MGKSTIGVIIGNANSNHISNLIKGMTSIAEEKGINIIFYLSYHMAFYNDIFKGEDNSQFDFQAGVVYDYALLEDVDALIFTCGSLGIFLQNNKLNDLIDKYSGKPYVILEDIDSRGKGSSVIADNYHGMHSLVSHLTDVHGYRNIAYLSGPKGNKDADERLLAFCNVMKEHNIDIIDSMIEYGDFSQNVERQVNNLLENNQKLECLVCANDLMATTAYQVISGRGLVIGSEIAVTGFDDDDYSETMNPPLTTVVQNEFEMAIAAIDQAMKLIDNYKPVKIISPAQLNVRSSCGCKEKVLFNNYMNLEAGRNDNNSNSENKEFIDSFIRTFSERVILIDSDSEIRDYLIEEIQKYVIEVNKLYRSGDTEHFDSTNLEKILDELFNGRYSQFISINAFNNMVKRISNDIIKSENDHNRLHVVSSIERYMSNILQTVTMRSRVKEITEMRDSLQYAPFISRDMMRHMDEPDEFYKTPLKILSFSSMKSGYIVVFDKPVKCTTRKSSIIREKMYVAASYRYGRAKGYTEEKRPCIKWGEGYLKNVEPEKSHVYNVYNLFMGDKQFGFLVCEVEGDNHLLMQQAAMQISLAIGYRLTYLTQLKYRQKLENMVDEVNEKNKILGLISSNDQLTNILNRRGFVENIMNAFHGDRGKNGIFILSDLDHLKEINDVYGHYAGDFALISSAEILTEALGENAVVSRYGGDEFASFIMSDDDIDADGIIAKLKEKTKAFNEASDKPFYVEFSVGYCLFNVENTVKMESLLQKADTMLYEAKKVRRVSVKK